MTTAPRLELLPAVDVAGGEAVQLVQGVAGTGGQFGDPWEAAKAWQDQGAEWLHLVDLDAAFGRGSNRELLAEIVGRLDIKVEMSGGIRDDASSCCPPSTSRAARRCSWSRAWPGRRSGSAIPSRRR